MSTAPSRLTALAALALAGLAAAPASGVIVSGGTPLAAPDNAWVGYWNGSSCVAIGPNWLVSAKHVGGSVGGFVSLKGVAYQVVEIRLHPQYDVQLLRVAEVLPGYHALNPAAALGDPVLLGGFGVTTAAPLPNNAGWDWNGNRQETWGANVIEGEGSLLTIRFDPPSAAASVPKEAAFGVNDSGAGLFTIASDGSLELAGIAVSVMNFGSAPWYTTAFALNSSLWRSWAGPIADPNTPISSGVAPPRAMLGIPGVDAVVGPALLTLALASLRRSRRYSTRSRRA